MKKIFIGILFVATAIFANSNLNIIDLKKTTEHYEAKTALFLDARPFKLYQRGTIMGAMNLPTKQFDKLKKFLPGDKGAALITFCNGVDCEKSDILAEQLQKDGYTNVLVYKGGYPEWKEKKKALMAIVKEKKAEVKATGAYKPPLEAVTVNGVTLHVLADDTEEGIEEGAIDQYWLAEMIKNGKALPKGMQLVDLRKTAKYDAEHIKGAINVPFDDKTEKMDLTKLPKDGIIVFYCNTGLKSTNARTSLEDELAERVFVFDATYKCDDKKKNCKLTPNEAL